MRTIPRDTYICPITIGLYQLPALGPRVILLIIDKFNIFSKRFHSEIVFAERLEKIIVKL